MINTIENKMIYRPLGKSGIKLSAVCFGTMRWNSEEDCRKIINRGLEAGMNYFDTSTGYVRGLSDVWTANAIRGKRSEVYYSSKSSFGSAPSENDTRRAIDKTLKRTGLDYFDFYQVWGLSSAENLKKALMKGGTVDGINKAVKDGLVKYGPGFTFHGTPDVFKAAIDSGVFLSATVSYNLMHRQEEELISYAANKGVGIIIMNPLAGGVLGMAGDKKYDFLRNGSMGTWYGALRFLLANKNITSSIVGFSQPGQVDDSMAALEDSENLGEAFSQDMINKMNAVKWTDEGFCTGCKYCEVCPNDFSPSKLMSAIRDSRIHGVNEKDLKNWIYAAYTHDILPEQALERCLECGICQEKCPQKLEIVNEIQRIKQVFGRPEK